MEKIKELRPYGNALEFIDDLKKHGPYLKALNDNEPQLKYFTGYGFPLYINNEFVYIGGYYEKDILQCKKVYFNLLLKNFQWQDGSGCGIIKEEKDGE